MEAASLTDRSLLADTITRKPNGDTSVAQLAVADRGPQDQVPADAQTGTDHSSSAWAGFKAAAMAPVHGLIDTAGRSGAWMAEHRKTVTIGLTALALGVSGCEPVGGPEPAPSLPSKSCYPAALGQQSPHLEDASFHVGGKQVTVSGGDAQKTLGIEDASSAHTTFLYTAHTTVAGNDNTSWIGSSVVAGDNVHTNLCDNTSTATVTDIVVMTHLNPSGQSHAHCSPIANVTWTDKTNGTIRGVTLDLDRQNSDSDGCTWHNGAVNINVKNSHHYVMDLGASVSIASGASVNSQVRLLDTEGDGTNTRY